MSSALERISVLEERIDNTDEKMTGVSKDVKSIAADVFAMREMMAHYQGASGVIKYITHAATAIIAASIGVFVTKH